MSAPSIHDGWTPQPHIQEPDPCDCTEPDRAKCPRLCQDFCNKREELRAALAAMEAEQRAEFEDYKRRCGGVPISTIRPD